MKCSMVREKLSEYLDGEPVGREAGAVAAHVQVCAECHAEAAALEQAEGALRALGGVEAAPELLADLRARLCVRPTNSVRWAWAGMAAGAIGAMVVWWALAHPQRADTSIRRPGEATVAKVDRVAQRGRGAQQCAPTKRPTGAQELARHSGSASSGRPAPSRQVGRQVPSTATKSEVPPQELVEAQPTTREPAPTEVAQSPAGLILILGEPEPVLPSGSCYIEVTHPDGTKSSVSQVIERDAAGKPRAIQVSYAQLAPTDEAPRQGG